VWQDACGGVTARKAILLKSLDLGRGERCGMPLPLIFGEQGKPRSSNALRVQRGIFHPARRADVRSKIFHGNLFVVTAANIPNFFLILFC
jgi:hypothetical protein